MLHSLIILGFALGGGAFSRLLSTAGFPGKCKLRNVNYARPIVILDEHNH